MAHHWLTMLLQPCQGKRSGLTRLKQHGRLARSHQSTRRDHFKCSHFSRSETLQNWSKVICTEPWIRRETRSNFSWGCKKNKLFHVCCLGQFILLTPPPAKYSLW